MFSSWQQSQLGNCELKDVYRFIIHWPILNRLKYIIIDIRKQHNDKIIKKFLFQKDNLERKKLYIYEQKEKTIKDY